jgi:isochorismate hydrolase
MSQRKKKVSNLITREGLVLIIIDAQDKLMPVIVQKDKIISNIVRLVKFCSITDIPIVITEQEKLGSTVVEIRNELPPEAVIQKVHFNCFSCEEFAERVKKIGRKTLILTGVEAHICVMQTALHALPFYNVQTVSDAISSRTVENRDVAIERMRDTGVTITSTEMFIYEILQKAGTDEFRSVLSLVK